MGLNLLWFCTTTLQCLSTAAYAYFSTSPDVSYNKSMGFSAQKRFFAASENFARNLKPLSYSSRDHHPIPLGSLLIVGRSPHVGKNRFTARKARTSQGVIGLPLIQTAAQIATELFATPSVITHLNRKAK
jgi:hypothetical protein